MTWYRTGTINLTLGSSAVTGAGTQWILNTKKGEALLGPDGKLYEIDHVSGDTALSLATAYAGASASGATYFILPTQAYLKTLAGQVADLITVYSAIPENASNAAASATAAQTYANQANASQLAAVTAQGLASTYKDGAGVSQTAAALSATNADTSKTGADASAAAALASKNAAGTSETNASASASTATTKAAAASTSASDAATSAAASLASKNAAGTSETNALASKNAAGTSETNALASKNAAATSATNAATSASNAATSESNANTSKNSAAASAAAANQSKNDTQAIKDSMTASAVTSVAGRTGAVVVTKTDVSLANVDNTTDVLKPVSTAQAAADEAIFNRAPLRHDYLAYESTTVCRLSRDGGGTFLWINGKNETIPAAGVTLAPTGMAGLTLYYAYAYMVGAVMTLEYASTVPVISATTGQPMKTGDATRTCVGMILSSGNAGQFYQDVSNLRVISWANRKTREVSGGYTASRTWSTGTFTELDIGCRSTFIHWGDENVTGVVLGNTSNGTAGSWVLTATAFNSSTVSRKSTSITQATGGFSNSIAMVDSLTPVRGQNYLTALSATANGGTGTWNLTSSVTIRG